MIPAPLYFSQTAVCSSAYSLALCEIRPPPTHIPIDLSYELKYLNLTAADLISWINGKLITVFILLWYTIAFLRSVYGEGEAGWKKFMESCLPVIPTDWGNMGMRDGLPRTAYLAAQAYNSRTVTGGVLCPAAKYCYDTATTTLPQGNWHLPTTDEIYSILDGVKYNSEGSDRNLDILNKALNLIGGSAISNGSYVWSCLRGSAVTAWNAHGYYGFFNHYYMYNANLAVPVSLYKLTE